MKRKIFFISGIVLILTAGIGILLYPYISNFIEQHNRELEIVEYDNSIQEMAQESLSEEWRIAEEYNSSHSVWRGADAFSGGNFETLPEEYLSALNVDGTMGYLSIPKINVHLPIRHGTSDDVLENSVGHLARSSLPIGGSGSHAVLTGHTGLPSAVLFTNLDKLAVGDSFTLHILDRVLSYEVDNIDIVLPENADSLHPVSGEDYVTLITCTPYGVNSHRLLVRGTRIETPETEKPSSISPPRGSLLPALWLIVPLIPVVIFLILIIRRRRKGKNAAK